ncbi:MAG: DUF3093 domain-containing protein [Mycobacteriaceae bacterium]
MFEPAPRPVSDDLSTPPAASRYRERLYVPAWWWLVGLGATSVLAYEVHMGTPSIPAWLPFLVTVPLTVWALWSLGALVVSVETTDDGAATSVAAPSSVAELRVGQAHLPVDVVTRVVVVPAATKRAALGRQLDPAAFVQHRTWVKTMVLVVLEDSEDPTPYWLVSTRRPQQLLEALRAVGAGGTA